MRSWLPLLLLVLLPWLPRTVAADETAAERESALVAAWLTAEGKERSVLGARVRACGPKAARALRAAAAEATPETTRHRRIERLLGRIREDHHRAHTPAGMIYIPAGLLEVPREGRPWGPSGERRKVPAFYIDRTEVTIEAWRTWLAKLDAVEEGRVKKLGLTRPRAELDGKLPVSRVRHPDAKRYAEAHGGRLPTADEFERALRGSGLATWPWGDRMRKGRANLLDHGPGEVTPVGRYPSGASAFGVLDLVGNVAEWSSTEVAQGRQGRYPLLLGGSYVDPPDAALTWRGLRRGRARAGSHERQGWIGFRLARTPPPLPR